MIDGFILSIQFFTKFYISKRAEYNNKNARIAQLFFPLTGLFIGLVMILVPYLNNSFNLGLSDEFLSLFILFFYIFITGGLHLDGFTDTIDGLSSQASGEKLKMIMKDSRIGAFGAIYLIIFLLAKYVFYKGALKSLYIIVLALVYSRILLTLLIYKGSFPGYNGMADFMHESNIGKISYIYIFGFFFFSYFYKKLLIIPALITLIYTIFSMRYFEKRIGYISGDILGFMAEMNELIYLITALGAIKWI